MDLREYLLTCLIEECSEVQKCATKIQRFGIDDQCPTNPSARINQDELIKEMTDVLAVMELVSEEFKLYSVERGCLQLMPPGVMQ